MPSLDPFDSEHRFPTTFVESLKKEQRPSILIKIATVDIGIYSDEISASPSRHRPS